jgi:hypothetical protein
MTWQDELVKTKTEKELYNLLEPIFRERTEKGTSCLMGVFMDLRDEKDQKEFINKIKNGLTNPSAILLELVDMFPESD